MQGQQRTLAGVLPSLSRHLGEEEAQRAAAALAAAEAAAHAAAHAAGSPEDAAAAEAGEEGPGAADVVADELPQAGAEQSGSWFEGQYVSRG